MIKSSRVNGVNVAYAIADPGKDDIAAAVSIGKTVKEIGQAAGATVSANFNFADTGSGVPIGRVIVGGKTVIGDIPKTAPRDELYMIAGALHIGKAPAGATWALQGSPRLLQAGRNVIAETVKRDQLGTDIWTGSAYRLAAGLTADGRLVVVRTMDKITLDALAAVMAALGCVDAINGDGGGSAYLWPSDNGWGRKMGAALIIKEGQDNMAKLIGDQKPELVIDPGHGGADPGASGNGIIEKRMTLDISLYQFKRAKELGISVALTRDSDITIDSTTRAALVKNSGARYCISNHINAATIGDSISSQGVETIHSIYSDGKLATAIMQAIADAGQVKRRTPVYFKTLPGNSKADYYYMHRETGTVSTVIVEYGFLSHSQDAARLKANWRAYAEAALRAYCRFTGRRYTPPAQPEPPKPTDDVTGHWAEVDIRAAQARGLLNGFPDGTFRPDEPVTRAQLAAVLARLT